jgi:hypothetical protein
MTRPLTNLSLNHLSATTPGNLDSVITVNEGKSILGGEQNNRR